MSVERLSSEITAKLRSGMAITSVPECVEELVLNSLDAGANCIDVRLDLTFFGIRVADNGRGIRFKDLELVGVRYATSKCRTLSDLYNTTTFGHRGEALSSIREVSQEMTITTRSDDVESADTYTKSFHGSVSSIDRSQSQRPSNGTTVTIHNFLFNLPVRQSSIRETPDVESVRRNLEILALVHPRVSFSLYDATTASHCLRVSNSSSVTATFGQLFGCTWVPLLKPVSGRHDSFAIEGFVAMKGHHSRRLQFVYVNQRRIADERLRRTINEIFDEGGSRITSFPVYVLFIDCPRKNYDLGLHPSKTLIRFAHYDELKLLLIRVVKDFVAEHGDVCGVSTISKPQEEAGEIEPDSRARNEAEIDPIHNYRHSLHSMAVKRPYVERNDDCITPNTLLNVPTEPPKQSREPECPLKILKHVPKKSLKSCFEGVIPTLYLAEKPKVSDAPFPICLSPAVGSHTTILAKLTQRQDRTERARKAVADLQKFSYRTLKKITHSTTDGSSRPVHRNPSSCLVVPLSNTQADCSMNESPDPGLFRKLEERYEPRSPCNPAINRPATCRPSEAQTFEATDSSTISVSKNVTSDTEAGVENARNWIIGSHSEADEQFYLDPMCGNSYFGKPATKEQLESHSATIVPSSRLLLDSAYGEQSCSATTILPSRPWRLKENETEEQQREVDERSLSSLYENWDNPILDRGDREESSSNVITVTRFAPSGPVDTLLSARSHSYTLSRDVFDELRFISQLDRKFILCLTTHMDIPQLAYSSAKWNLLVLFDQHAVHERIRLERFLNDAGFYNESAGLTTSVLDSPLSLVLPTDVVRIASKCKTQLTKCGVCVSEDEAGDSQLTVHSLPSCFIKREASECKQQRASVLKDLAEKLILELTENLLIGLPVRPMPRVILDVLKSQACHGAVKFGHRLTAARCKQLMAKLRKCKLPFQCAHGRPSIATLVDLNRIPTSCKTVSKPNLNKLNLMMKAKNQNSTDNRQLPSKLFD